jgi:hypothetical protein
LCHGQFVMCSTCIAISLYSDLTRNCHSNQTHPSLPHTAIAQELSTPSHSLPLRYMLDTCQVPWFLAEPQRHSNLGPSPAEDDMKHGRPRGQRLAPQEGSELINCPLWCDVEMAGCLGGCGVLVVVCRVGGGGGGAARVRVRRDDTLL